jgi:hypothetical protein
VNNKVTWGVIGSAGIARRRTIPEGIIALATVDTFFCIPDESSKNILELYGTGEASSPRERVPKPARAR